MIRTLALIALLMMSGFPAYAQSDVLLPTDNSPSSQPNLGLVPKEAPPPVPAQDSQEQQSQAPAGYTVPSAEAADYPVACDLPANDELRRLQNVLPNKPPKLNNSWSPPGQETGACILVIQACSYQHTPLPGTPDGEACKKHSAYNGWYCGAPISCTYLAAPATDQPGGICSAYNPTGCAVLWEQWQQTYAYQ